MANFNRVIDTPNANPTIIAAPASGGSFLRGLSNFAQQASGAYRAITAEREATRNEERSQAVNAAVLEASNQLSAAEFGAQLDREQATVEAGFVPDAYLNGAASALPRDEIKSALADLKRTKLAAAQGRFNEDSFNIRLDAVQRRFMNMYPEFAADIAQEFRQAGFSNYTLREITQNNAVRESRLLADVTAANQIRAEALRAAQEEGFMFNPDDPTEREAAIAYGNKALADAANNRRQTQILAAARAEAEADEATLASAEKKSRLEIMSRARGQAQELVGGLNTQFMKIYLATPESQRGSVATDLAGLRGEYVTRVLGLRDSMISRLTAQSGDILTQEDYTAVNTMFDNLIKEADTNVFNAYATDNARALGVMASTLKMDMARAMPAYSAMVGAMGQSATNAYLTALQANPALATQAAKELAEWDPTKPETMPSTLINIGLIRKGELTVDHLPPDQAVKTVGRLALTTRQQQIAAARDGRIDPAEAEGFYNSTAQLQRAAQDLPTNASPTSLWAASDATFSADSIAAFRALERTPGREQDGRLLIESARSSASTVLATSLGQPQADRGWIVKYDKARGVFTAQQDPKARAALEAAARNPSRMGPRGPVLTPEGQAAQGLSRTLPADLKIRMDVQNRALGALAGTKEYDDAVPPGISDRALREHYALGTPMTGPDGKPVKPAGQQAREVLENLRTDMNQRTTALALDDAVRQRTDLPQWDPNDPRWAYATVRWEASANSRPYQEAVAAAIINRANMTGRSLMDTVLEGNGSQFNVWSSRDPALQRILGMTEEDFASLRSSLGTIVERREVPEALKGIDSFFDPDAMRAKGLAFPDWGNKGDHIQIGRGYFFRGKYRR